MQKALSLRRLGGFTAPLAALGLAASGCTAAEPGESAAASTGDSADTGPETGIFGDIVPDWSGDILSTDLSFDFASGAAIAVVVVTSPDSDVISLEVGDLAILSVSEGGSELRFVHEAAQLDISVEPSDQPHELSVAYTARAHDNFDGWMPASGVTFLWPYWCGNLFPCHSAPADGLSLALHVSGIPEGQTAVFPESIPADAPSYMPAIAVGEYSEVSLGTTTAGTEVKMWTSPDGVDDGMAGTTYLVDAFDFFEQTYGAYTFGPVVGSVSVDWGGGDFGGMEHHPYWHVSSGSMYDPDTHSHEAAHGWFGDGVRISCWEDFVLSEGTTTYLSLHANEGLGNDLWAGYDDFFVHFCESDANTIALPDETCNEIDLLNDPLWSSAPYIKGAFFYREVARVIGADTLDAALADFYQAHVGGSARMQEMVDHLETGSPEHAGEIEALATAWLRTLECP